MFLVEYLRVNRAVHYEAIHINLFNSKTFFRHLNITYTHTSTVEEGLNERTLKVYLTMAYL